MSQNLSAIVHAAIAMIAVINPVVCAAMILKIKAEDSDKKVYIESLKTMGIVLVILLISALAGKYILHSFGISMDAFKIVGGLVLSFIGFQMLSGSKNDNQTKEKSDMTQVILFAASPGSIAMAVTLSTVHDPSGFPLKAVVGIVLAVTISVIVITAIELLSAKKNIGGQGIVSKFMGLIIIAMGVQFLLEGIKNYFEI